MQNWLFQTRRAGAGFPGPHKGDSKAQERAGNGPWENQHSWFPKVGPGPCGQHQALHGVTQREPVASPRLHTRPDPRRARNTEDMQPSTLLKDTIKQNRDLCGGRDSSARQSSSLPQPSLGSDFRQMHGSLLAQLLQGSSYTQRPGWLA